MQVREIINVDAPAVGAPGHHLGCKGPAVQPKGQLHGAKQLCSVPLGARTVEHRQETLRVPPLPQDQPIVEQPLEF